MNKVVGFAMCGSFCTFKEVIPQIEMLKKLNYDIVPIMSEIAYETDTRFGKAEEFRYKIETICKHENTPHDSAGRADRAEKIA